MRPDGDDAPAGRRRVITGAASGRSRAGLATLQAATLRGYERGLRRVVPEFDHRRSPTSPRRRPGPRRPADCERARRQHGPNTLDPLCVIFGRAIRCDRSFPGRIIHVQRGSDHVEREQGVKSDAGERDMPIIDALASELASHKLRVGRQKGVISGLHAETTFDPSIVRNGALKVWTSASEKRRGDAECVGIDPSDVELLDPLGLHEERATCARVLNRVGRDPEGDPEDHGPRHHRDDNRPARNLMPDGLDEAAKRATPISRPRLDSSTSQRSHLRSFACVEPPSGRAAPWGDLVPERAIDAHLARAT